MARDVLIALKFKPAIIQGVAGVRYGVNVVRHFVRALAVR